MKNFLIGVPLLNIIYNKGSALFFQVGRWLHNFFCLTLKQLYRYITYEV